MNHFVTALDENKALGSLIQTFNKAILALKKEFVLSDADAGIVKSRLHLTESEKEDARDFVKGFLGELNGDLHIEYPQRLSKRDISVLEQAVSNNAPLNIEQLKLLDLLLFSMDEARSIQYRKLKEDRIE